MAQEREVGKGGKAAYIRTRATTEYQSGRGQPHSKTLRATEGPGKPTGLGVRRCPTGSSSAALHGTSAATLVLKGRGRAIYHQEQYEKVPAHNFCWRTPRRLRDVERAAIHDGSDVRSATRDGRLRRRR